MKCYKCWMLDVKDREIKQLKEQQEAILDMMQLALRRLTVGTGNRTREVRQPGGRCP